MGEARKNETAIDVVSRFAEARSPRPWPPPDDVLTLGNAFGDGRYDAPAGGCRFDVPRPDGLPWVEFEGIPWDPGRPPNGPFLGRANPTGDGTNLRFVDLHWGDLLADDYPHVGQDPNAWANGLLGRLIRRDADLRENRGRPGLPFWSIRILEVLRETIALVHGFTRLRAQELDDLVFTKYLGDVQVYAEYAHNRGRAVRRFHEHLDRLERAHDERERSRSDGPPRPARYSVIAHSLGTVLSFDALLYARARMAFRTGLAGGVPNFPFPGYVTDAERDRLRQAARAARGARETLPDELSFLDTNWARRVDTFTTLGSPVDKFLFIWWLNYQYLGSAAWVSDSDPGRRILHFNYSDEQDPVGHRLEEVAKTPAYGAVFRSGADVVFNRYALPGLAHVQYWKDLDLFRWILKVAVDRPPDPGPAPAWFDPKVYRRVLLLSYTVVPWLVVLVLAFGTTWAWFTDSVHSAALISVGLYFVGLAGRHLIDLVLWWRQLLRAKATAVGANVQFLQTLRDVFVGLPAQAWRRVRHPREAPAKEGMERSFRGRLAGGTALWLALAGLATGTYLDGVAGYRWAGFLWERALLILGVILVTGVLWRRLFRSPNAAE
jgi:predicted ribosomally synthesized peptide with SipW-like signal peptide